MGGPSNTEATNTRANNSGVCRNAEGDYVPERVWIADQMRVTLQRFDGASRRRY